MRSRAWQVGRVSQVRQVSCSEQVDLDKSGEPSRQAGEAAYVPALPAVPAHPALSVLEVPAPDEDHRQTLLVGRSDHFGVAH
jgi:hypothetical protein